MLAKCNRVLWQRLPVSQDAQWFQFLKEEGHILNVNDAGALKVLIEQMQARRNIFSTMDHMKPDVKSVKAELFGKPISIPSLELELAKSNGYLLVFIGPESTTNIVDSINAADKIIQELANWYTANLEQQIIKQPARWLMWPNMRFTLQDAQA